MQQYFCYEDTASIDGSSPHGYYSSQCWKQQSIGPAAPAVRGTLAMVKWRRVEPEDGVFDWRELDANVTTMTQLGLQVIHAH